MRVLCLAHSYPRFAADPVGSFILRLSVALQQEGVEVLTLAPTAEGLALDESYEGVRVHRYHYAPRAWETLAYTGTMADQVRSGLPAKLGLLGLLWAGRRATRTAIRQFKPDLIHAHWWFPGGLTAWLAVGSGSLPWIITSHGSDLRVAARSPLGGRLFRAVARRARIMTTVSSWLAAEARALAPGLEPVVAPMPVAGHLFSPGESRDRDRLLFVGKLNRQKGFGFLLRALAAMRQRPVVEVVVGVGSERADAEAEARALGVAGQLRWHPLLEQAELATLYRNCTALVMPAVDEGLGLVAAEAMLSAMPVVAFASGGLTDIVLPGQTGYLVPPGDVPALAGTLDQLLSLPDQGAGLGREGRVVAVARFSPAAAARRYAELYRSACPAPAGG
jgi:glycosyltransferase involved in cell wall biosynthesis